VSAVGAVRAFLRPAAFSLVAGLFMGAAYWALDLTSPAPPLLGLTGLAGIVIGERAATAVRNRLTRRRTAPPSPEEGNPRVP
jgi:XapX domain-containing protein